MNDDTRPTEPDLSFPVEWDFKIIGRTEDQLRSAVAAVLAECLPSDEPPRDHSLEFSRSSKGGQYVSMLLRMTVRDRPEKDALFQALTLRPEIRLVI